MFNHQTQSLKNTRFAFFKTIIADFESLLDFLLIFFVFLGYNNVNDNAKVYQIIIQKYTTSTECCKGTKSLLYITCS